MTTATNDTDHTNPITYNTIKRLARIGADDRGVVSWDALLTDPVFAAIVREHGEDIVSEWVSDHVNRIDY